MMFRPPTFGVSGSPLLLEPIHKVESEESVVSFSGTRLGFEGCRMWKPEHRRAADRPHASGGRGEEPEIQAYADRIGSGRSESRRLCRVRPLVGDVACARIKASNADPLAKRRPAMVFFLPSDTSTGILRDRSRRLRVFGAVTADRGNPGLECALGGQLQAADANTDCQVKSQLIPHSPDETVNSSALAAI